MDRYHSDNNRSNIHQPLIISLYSSAYRKMKRYVISVGGSIINPEPGKVDIVFLEKLREIINSFDARFVIVVGGGKTARSYQECAKAFHVSSDDLDWIGIMVTRVNAEIVRSVFSAKKKVIYDPSLELSFGNEKTLIAAGWKPGWSTDYDAVLLARNVGAKTVINMTNVDYLHDKDPRKYKTAKKIENISWKGFRKI